MWNLILKDIRLQKNALFTLLPALFIYLFSGLSVTWVGIVFCIVIIMNVFSKDEKSSSNILWNALPYTRKEIVSSKYIGALIFTTLILLTILAGNWIIHQEFIQWEQIILVTSIVIFFTSFAFPFAYVFKIQYIVNASLILLVLYLFTVSTFIPDLNDRIRGLVQTIIGLDDIFLQLIVILSAAVLYFLSWLLSIWLYSRKVF